LHGVVFDILVGSDNHASLALSFLMMTVRVEVDAQEVHIMGSKKRAPAHARRSFKRKNGGFCSAQFSKWRARRDSNS
jgi:hypothetical protein